ncbi:hypothetical protein GCM10009000_061340 [Halobacterium noricense]
MAATTDRVSLGSRRLVGIEPSDLERPVGSREIENVRTAGGSIINSQDEVGGYPDLPVNTRSLDVPEAGTRPGYGRGLATSRHRTERTPTASMWND